MGIANEIARIQQAKADLKTSINAKGGTITNETIDQYASKVSALPEPKEEQQKTITPDFSSGNVVVTPTSGKVLSQVTINKDGNLVAENIKKDITVNGITGTLEGGGGPGGYDLTITTKSMKLWEAGSIRTYYDNFYYKVNNETDYRTISYPVTNLVIPNVIIVAFYYDLDWPYDNDGYSSITGDYTKIGDYYWLDGPLSITFYSSYPCFVKGTKITLEDKTYKNVEDITYDDKLLVWDFDKGEFTTAKPIWIMKPQKAQAYNKLVFSDGSELRTVNQHRIFNEEQDKFTYPMTEDTPIGTTTFNDKGELITLVSKEVVEEEVEYYNIITDYHINLFASSILTSCRLSNLYPIKDMKYIKDDRELHSPEIFNEVSPKWVRGLRLLEQPLEVNRENAVKFDNSLVDYVKRLESTKL